ncbi:MAG: hypothetical protein MI865_00475, partial [Proteobacteria bacterium]|nr:hypothetical protein [Pseudomonadota bacterium]
MDARNRIQQAYELVKKECGQDWKSKRAGEAIRDLGLLSVRFLRTQCEEISLHSKVSQKSYITFKRDKVVARPANKDLITTDPRALDLFWQRWQNGQATEEQVRVMTYSIALAPCLVMELFDRQNKKGPATYFECLIGHLVSSALGTNPERKAFLPVHGRDIRLTMDFLYHLDG